MDELIKFVFLLKIGPPKVEKQLTKYFDQTYTALNQGHSKSAEQALKKIKKYSQAHGLSQFGGGDGDDRDGGGDDRNGGSGGIKEDIYIKFPNYDKIYLSKARVPDYDDVDLTRAPVQGYDDVNLIKAPPGYTEVDLTRSPPGYDDVNLLQKPTDSAEQAGADNGTEMDMEIDTDTVSNENEYNDIDTIFRQRLKLELGL